MKLATVVVVVVVVVVVALVAVCILYKYIPPVRCEEHETLSCVTRHGGRFGHHYAPLLFSVRFSLLSPTPTILVREPARHRAARYDPPSSYPYLYKTLAALSGKMK